MIQIIDNPKLIVQYQRKFINELKQDFILTMNAYVGYMGGTEFVKLHYSKKFNIWFTTREIGSKFWNGFGFGKPEEDSLESLTSEINIDRFGINRRIGGAFGRDDEGNILILHRGKIGGGKAGIGKTLFFEKYRGKFVNALDGDRISEFALLGFLNSMNLSNQIVNYVKEIKRIKHENKLGIQPFPKITKSKKVFNEEFAGTKIYTKNELIEAKCNHGIVVNTLADQLKYFGFSVGNDKNRDLFVYNEKGQINILFEIKTDTLNQSLYSAIGQLFLYTIDIEPSPKLFLVLPDLLKEKIEKKLSFIGLNVLYYEWKEGQPFFKDIKKKIMNE